VALGEGDPTPIMKRMKNIEDHFMGNPVLHDAALARKIESKEEDKNNLGNEKFTN